MKQAIKDEFSSYLETINTVINSMEEKLEAASALAVETLKMEIKSYFVEMVEVQQMLNI